MDLHLRVDHLEDVGGESTYKRHKQGEGENQQDFVNTVVHISRMTDRQDVRAISKSRVTDRDIVDSLPQTAIYWDRLTTAECRS